VPAVDPNLARQRKVVDAFFAAARARDFDALVRVLDPDVVVRSDGGTAHPQAFQVLRGAKTVAHMAIAFARRSLSVLPVLVNGAAGVLIVADGHPIRVMGFTVSRGKIVTIDRIGDPERLNKLDLAALERLPRSA
jgi:RNA polymerase sigma-70 factor (ECF subfamily)